MSDLIKKEQLSGKKVVVGDKYTDLVLRTLGRVYVQTGSKMTLLNDLIKSIEATPSNNTVKDSIIFVDKTTDLNSLNYPGDGVFIFVKNNQNLYISTGNNYIPIVAKNEAEINWETLKNAFVSKLGDTIVGDLEADNFIAKEQFISNTQNNPPLKVASKTIVKNLNSNYLNGYSDKEFAKKKENEVISGSWDFKNNTTFTGDTLHGGSLWSKGGFAGGFAGYGWMLDTRTNTLTVDNLVVRKIMHVYELVVNKIMATNGSLWVSDSAKIESLRLVYLIDVNDDTQEKNPTETDEMTIVSDELDIDAKIEMADEDNLTNVEINIYDHYFNGNFYMLYLDDDNKKYCPFRVNDILRCQKFTGTAVKFYNCIVTNINYSLDFINEDDDGKGNSIIVRLENSDTDLESLELTHPKEGDGIVRVGNISDDNRQGAVYITSSEENSPYINVSKGMNRPNYSELLPVYVNGLLKYNKPTVVRLGKIDGIRDDAFGVNQPEGMGLFAENVFLKGRLVQTENGIDYPTPLYRGEYDENETYYYYDYVTYNSKAYLCVHNGYVVGTGPITGIAPDGIENRDKAFWKVYLEGGADGGGLMFSGIWDAETQYYLRKDLRTVIKIENNGVVNYYQTKLFSETDLYEVPEVNEEGLIPIPLDELPYTVDSFYWKPFGGQFTSIATNVLLAEEAYLAGFRFHDNKLVSEYGTINGVESQDTFNSDFIPNLELDGINGSIKANSGIIGGWEIMKDYLKSPDYTKSEIYNLYLNAKDEILGPSLQLTKNNKTTLSISPIAAKRYSFYDVTEYDPFTMPSPGIMVGEEDNIYRNSVFTSIGDEFINIHHKEKKIAYGLNDEDVDTFADDFTNVTKPKLNAETGFYEYYKINNLYLSHEAIRFNTTGFNLYPVGSQFSGVGAARILLECHTGDTYNSSPNTNHSATLFLKANNKFENKSEIINGIELKYIKSPVFGLITEGCYIKKNDISKGFISNTFRIIAFMTVNTISDSNIPPISEFLAVDYLTRNNFFTELSRSTPENGKNGGKIRIGHNIGNANYRVIAMARYGYVTLNELNSDYFEITTSDDSTPNGAYVDLWIIDTTGVCGVDFDNVTRKYNIKNWQDPTNPR